MNKFEKIDRKEQQVREKIATWQNVLKKIDGERTEQENMQIVKIIRHLKLPRKELYAFLNSGILPPSLAGAIGISDAEGESTAGGENAEMETVYSRRKKPDSNAEPDERTAQIQENTNNESEDMSNE